MQRPSIAHTLTAPPLTRREVEMLNWIMAGKTDWEIATILRLSKKTVNYHVENAKKKLGSAHRITAVAVALRDGLISFPAPPTFASRAVSGARSQARSQAHARPPTIEALGTSDIDSVIDTDSMTTDMTTDMDTDGTLPWAIASWQIPDDSGAGPCPAVLVRH